MARTGEARSVNACAAADDDGRAVEEDPEDAEKRWNMEEDLEEAAWMRADSAKLKARLVTIRRGLLSPEAEIEMAELEDQIARIDANIKGFESGHAQASQPLGGSHAEASSDKDQFGSPTPPKKRHRGLLQSAGHAERVANMPGLGGGPARDEDALRREGGGICPSQSKRQGRFDSHATHKAEHVAPAVA